MRLPYPDKQAMLKACLGEIPADLAITNGKIVNVFTGEILDGTVYVFQGFICHVDYDGEALMDVAQVVDAQGSYIIPGLIDSHMHIESSMLTPRNFAKVAVPWGTTTVVTDPHEIANVLGVEGVTYMLEASEDLPMRQFVDIPSCVPAAPAIEKSGGDFTAKTMEQFIGHNRVIGLAEVMDFLAVVHGEQRMTDILDTATKAGLYLQGHAPSLPPRMLSAYLAAGPSTCHESRSGEEALRKLRYGMYVDARESSMTRNIRDIWNGVKDCKFFDHLTLCTDDREADDILKMGHMNDVVNCAISYGMEPVTAIKSVTLNTAREIHMENLGAIAPGFVADMLLVKDLKKIVPHAVYFQGKLVAKEGALVEPVADKTFSVESKNTIQIPDLKVSDFTIPAPVNAGQVRLNVQVYPDHHAPMTQLSQEPFQVENGLVTLNNDPQLKFVAVVNRHGHNRMAISPIRGFGSCCGAIASTVSHDCHNIVVVYEKPEDALIAVQQLKLQGGGMCDVLDGEILATLPLPIGGLLSKLEASDLAKCSTAMKEANRKLGMTAMENPLLRIATLALPVIPEARMTDAGLVHVRTQTVLPLFVED